MTLNQEQKEHLTTWVQQGLPLAEIQRLLRETFQLNLTYMDVRFLVDDLGLTIASKPKPADPLAGFQAPLSGAAVPEGLEENGYKDAEATFASVKVSVDKIQRPGAMISGSVVFSDRQTAGWQIDQMGRLGLIPATAGYNPSPEDIQEFQHQLQIELQKHGF